MTDVRVGDLVKATNKTDPEVTVTARALYVSPHDGGLDVKGHNSLPGIEWTFEVLDRPLPPISDELLEGAAKAYVMGQGYALPSGSASAYSSGIAAVINFVRSHDNKESK